MVRSDRVQSLVYSLDEFRPIRSKIELCRSSLSQFLDQSKALDTLDLECRLLNRCVYKNWNARHAELGIQASRRTVRLFERFVNERPKSFPEILQSFQLETVEIRLPTRGTLNQVKNQLDISTLILKSVQKQSKLAVKHLRLECSRTNYVQYNILIMSLCSRIFYLSAALEKAQQEFSNQLEISLKSFKKKITKD